MQASGEGKYCQCATVVISKSVCTGIRDPSQSRAEPESDSPTQWPGLSETQRLSSPVIRVGMAHHAGYTCLGCRQTWSSLFQLGQHRNHPHKRGTPCGSMAMSAELRSIRHTTLPTGMVRAEPIFTGICVCEICIFSN